MSNPLGIEFEEQPGQAPGPEKKKSRPRDPEKARDEEVVTRTRAARDESAGAGAEEEGAPPTKPSAPTSELPRPAVSSPTDPRVATLSGEQRRLVADLMLAAWPYQRERVGNDQLLEGAISLVRHLERVGLMSRRS